MAGYIVPVLILLLIVYSFIKKNNTYQSFVGGVKSSFDLVLTSFPYIATIFIAIEETYSAKELGLCLCIF